VLEALDIFVIDLAAEPLCPALLSPAERRRAASFRLPRPARRYVAARCALRRRLAGSLGVPPGDLVIASDRFGKPFLDGVPGIAFNLAHSSEIALLAVHRAPRCATPVGIDIEPTAPPPEAAAIVRGWFGDSDRITYEALPTTARDGAFARLWTRKEAVAKAAGGIAALPLDRFAVGLEEWAAVAGTPWQVRSFTPAPGHVAALATRRKGQ